MSEKKFTTSQKHAQLKNYSTQAKDALYQRLKLTTEILADHEYIDRIFGSQPRAMEVLEANEWSDFSGRPGLSVLLKAFAANPEREKWEQYKYDWAAMIELSLPERDETAAMRVSWKAKYEEAQERIAELEHRVKAQDEIISRLLAETK